MDWKGWALIVLVLFILWSHYNQERGYDLEEKAISGVKNVFGGVRSGATNLVGGENDNETANTEVGEETS